MNNWFVVALTTFSPTLFVVSMEQFGGGGGAKAFCANLSNAMGRGGIKNPGFHAEGNGTPYLPPNVSMPPLQTETRAEIGFASKFMSPQMHISHMVR